MIPCVITCVPVRLVCAKVSTHFAEKLITEAKEAGMLDMIIDKDALRKYTWRSKNLLFDEAP